MATFCHYTSTRYFIDPNYFTLCFKTHSVMDDEIIMTRIGVRSYVYRNIPSFDIITVQVTRGIDPYSSSNKSKQIVHK